MVKFPYMKMGEDFFGKTANRKMPNFLQAEFTSNTQIKEGLKYLSQYYLQGCESSQSVAFKAHIK